MANPVVSIKQGQLKGTTDTDINGGTILKFRGIPYAKPPVGALRFKAPQPPEAWEGIKDATEDGNPCISIQMNTNKPGGSEDCLYLNVFTRALPNENDGPKPVMLFLHGGGFVGGSNSEAFNGPRFLLTQDVVLVTCNYRLGIFGFLSLDDPFLEVPGNAGLKDQTCALKWVQENISSFNGDPNNVTIFGVSAGGVSVQHQILSPTAKGLFHKAITHSGSVFNPWTWGQKNNAIHVAEKLGQVTNNGKQALEILMKEDPMKLFGASLQLRDSITDCSKRRPFGPVIEDPNPTAFLSENPTELLESGKYNQVPTIVGCCSNEGLFAEFARFTGDTVDGYESGLLWCFGLEEGSKQREKLKQLIKEFYFKDGIDKSSIYKLIADVAFLVGIVESTKLSLSTSSKPIYNFLFDYETPMGNIIKQMVFGVDASVKGVGHGGEESCLFSSVLNSHLTPEDQEAINLMVKMWTDFAKTGKPHEQWQPNEKENFKYFVIDKEVSMRQGYPFAERIAFWEKILQEFGGLNLNYSVKA